jgi:hypothetical protein
MHSEKVTSLYNHTDSGRDPKFFFSESTLNAEATTYIPEVNLSPSTSADQSTHPRGYHSNTPSPTTSDPAVENTLWSTTDISSHKYFPASGPWGIIPSRSIMITNLPKTTQLWTLVELLKVFLCYDCLDNRDSGIELGFLQRRFSLMDQRLFPFMTFAMPYVVFATSVMTTSLRIVDLIHISSQLLLSSRYHLIIR